MTLLTLLSSTKYIVLVSADINDGGNVDNVDSDITDDNTDNIDCPGPDEAFVTTCSGGSSDKTTQTTSPSEETDITEDDLFDESDLVNEVLEDSTTEQELPPKQSQPKYTSNNNNSYDYERQHQQKQQQHFDTNFNSKDDRHSNEEGMCNSDDGPMALQQFKQTTTKLMQRYYDPLPKQGKMAIGTIVGFTASRLSLGVANRIFRIAGATWVLSEMAHSSGFCDEAQCVPEEARPWIGIVKRALINQCIKVRLFARRIWNQDRIRELAQKDELVAAMFAAGAFIGFIV